MTDPPGPPEKPDDSFHSPWRVPFQPDTTALLSLLGSPVLYSTPLMAVRELVQNAFDAVLMAFARARVALSPEMDAADPSFTEYITLLHQVSLKILENRNHLFLTCQDTGPGLTVAEVYEAILRPGRGPSAAWQDLSNDCQALGFRLPGS